MGSRAVIIPYTALSAEALQGVIEEFVSREGTDYGHLDISLDKKCRAVMQQLKNGTAILIFNQDEETIDIVPKDQVEFLPFDDSPRG